MVGDVDIQAWNTEYFFLVKMSIFIISSLTTYAPNSWENYDKSTYRASWKGELRPSMFNQQIWRHGTATKHYRSIMEMKISTDNNFICWWYWLWWRIATLTFRWSGIVRNWNAGTLLSQITVIQDGLKIGHEYSTVPQVWGWVSEQTNERRGVQEQSEQCSAERANEWAVRANERVDERVAQC